jgi:hypothetical protein
MRKIKIIIRKGIWMLPFVSHLFCPICFAEYTFDVTPSVAVSTTYDDNIYLTDAGREADFITALSPAIDMSLSSVKSILNIEYSPTWVWYGKNDQHNTVRQSASAAFSRNITERLAFDIADSYTKSEEPVETLEDIERFRTGRSTYQRNRGSASVAYQFGRENSLALGYVNSLVENEDPTLDDGLIQTPRCSIDYWMNNKNGLGFDYRFTKAIFWRDEAPPSGDDYEGHGAALTYIRRFTPHTRGSIRYDYTARDFEGLTEDYAIHEETLGFAHSFSPNLSFSLQGGYFTQINKLTENTTGYTYNASVLKRFERGTVSAGGRGGWEEAYLEAEQRGFLRYRTANSSLTYQLTANLDSYIGASFRWEKDQDDLESRIWRANCGLSLEFLRWFSLSLDYTYRTRDDDDDEFDYTDNRVMLTLTAAKPNKW